LRLSLAEPAYGVFSTPGTAPRVGVAIGDRILDLSRLEGAGLLELGTSSRVFDRADVNAFMALGQDAWSSVRASVSALLDAGNARLRDDAELSARAVVPMAAARMHLPFYVRSFTDFYASREHASAVGAMLRGPENALPPNWLHIPLGYNGRASTVVVSGQGIRRPLGQFRLAGTDAPCFGPCRKLDFELELGAIVGVPSTMGEPLTVAQAEQMIFGYVLLNDWSARDIQAWEYQPLGPFQAKAFATSISPWIVTREALEPFRVPPPDRLKPLLAYLREATPNNYDIELAVSLTPQGGHPTTISRTNFRHMYYSPAQQLAHHAVGGCAMCTGDLLGSGTISGPSPGSAGSLIELSHNGTQPVCLQGGETRTFLEDGDTLTLTGCCRGANYRVGFGVCAGQILPANAEPGW
jgi:fumarylacetoacetase